VESELDIAQVWGLLPNKFLNNFNTNPERATAS